MELILLVLPGLGEMVNIHPLLVHFPIALLQGFLLMEILGFLLKKEEMINAATWMLYLGTLGAMATVIAGFFAASSVPHNEEIHAIMTRHMYFGIVVLLLSLLLSIMRLMAKKKTAMKGSIANLIIGFIMVTLMAIGADLGGLMVYKYGVAVKAVTQPKAHNHSMGGHGADEMDMEGMMLEGHVDSVNTHNHDADDHSTPHKH